MNFRLIAGISLLLAVLTVLPASALPDIRSLSQTPEVKTGTVWVTLTDINGSMQEEPVKIVYATGAVAEISRVFVSEDARTGVVTVTMNESLASRQYALVTRNVTGDALYVINSIAVAQESEPLLSNGQSFAIVPATANYYADTVPEGKHHEWVDLDWKDTNRDLNLTVYAPDATFGPYSDASDGKKDGRIFLDFSSLLNVTAGNWFFRVQSTNHEFTPYTLNTYSA
ncbi:MAG: hypothetical protein LUQ71_08360 [Methanoregula sp.]|nr:hypothetical protein [Methanoregula sp.]